MCYEINENETRKIAEQDIVVYKIMRRIDETRAISEWQHYFYKQGEKNPHVELYENSCGKINDGYHFYEIANSGSAKCIIPKGATYYVNDGIGVASDLIFVEWI